MKMKKKINCWLLLAAAILMLSAKDPLPLKVDLSPYCPSLKTQYGATCYAYAFAYTALSINYCVKNGITDPGQVESNAFSPGFIASMHRKNSFMNFYCGRRGNYDVDLKIFGESGCAKLSDFKEDCNSTIPESVMVLAKQVSLKEYHYIQQRQSDSQEAVMAIKSVLARKIPVLITLNMTDDFSRLGRDANQELPVLKKGTKSTTAHDIVIIGFDDDPDSKYHGRFLVKNNFSIFGDERNMAWVKYEDMMYMISHALYFTIA